MCWKVKCVVKFLECVEKFLECVEKLHPWGSKRDGRKIIKYSRTTLVVTLIDFFSKTGFIMRPHRGCMGDDLAENLFDCKEN